MPLGKIGGTVEDQRDQLVQQLSQLTGISLRRAAMERRSPPATGPRW